MPAVAAGTVSLTPAKADTGSGAAGPASLGAIDAQESWRELLASLDMEGEDGSGESAAMLSSGPATTTALEGKQNGSLAREGAAPSVSTDATAKRANLAGGAGRSGTGWAERKDALMQQPDLPLETQTASDVSARKPEPSGRSVSALRAKKQQHAPCDSTGARALSGPAMAAEVHPAQPPPPQTTGGAVRIKAETGEGQSAAPVHDQRAIAEAAGARLRSRAEPVGEQSKSLVARDENRDEKFISLPSRSDELASFGSAVAERTHREDDPGKPFDRNPSVGDGADQPSLNPVSAEQNPQVDLKMTGGTPAPAGAGAAPSAGAGKRSRSTSELAAQPMRTSGGDVIQREKLTDEARVGNGQMDNTAPARELTAVQAALGNPGEHSGPGAGASEDASRRETFSALDLGSGFGETRWSHATPAHAEAGFQDPALGWVGVRADVLGGGIHAAVVPGSIDAAQALAGHMAGLGAHLAAQHLAVHSVSVATPDAASGGWGGGPNGQNSAPGGNGGNREQGNVARIAEAMQKPASTAKGSDSLPPSAGSMGGIGRGEYISVLA